MKNFEEITNEGIDEIQDLSKHIDFDKLVYFFKGESGQQNADSFKSPLACYRNIKSGCKTLEKAEEN